MSTADRDPSSLPVPAYWIVCICIAALSVICGIVVCICLDRHMKKKLMAYLNEHQELQSIASEEEINAVSKTKRMSEIENDVSITVTPEKVKKSVQSGKNVNKSLVKKTTAITPKRTDGDEFVKEEVPGTSVNIVNSTKVTSNVTAIDSPCDEGGVSNANYFESDGNIEADSVVESEEGSPQTRLEPSTRRHNMPPKNMPVKSLKKKSAGMTSSNPNSIMVAAIAAKAAVGLAVKPSDGSGEQIAMATFSKIDDNENDIDNDIVFDRGGEIVYRL